ncbi:MAG: hypothetical protein PHD53_06685 [Methylococcales bacterium]|nr:hypothetical protein [Methylococcales bacterium]
MKRFTQFVVLSVLYILGGIGAAMENNEVDSLVFEPEPLGSSDLLKMLDITSVENIRGFALPGTEDESELRVVDGRVSVGKPLVYKLKNPKSNLLSQHNEKYHFYLVEFRFTLHPPENKRRYEEMKLEVKLADPKVSALRLLPTSVKTEIDISQTFDIGFSIAHPESPQISVGAKSGQTVTFKQLLPITTAFGNGESNFYWIYSKPPGTETVEPGTRMVATVIQVPDGLRSLSATIQWTVKLNRSIFGEWRDVPVNIEPITVNLPLT